MKIRFLFLSLIFSIFYFSCGSSGSDSMAITDLYGRLVESYQEENLRGVLMPVSKDFQAKGDNYETLKAVYAQYFLMNSEVSMNITDLQITFEDNLAEARYGARLISNETSIEFSAVDSLKKSWGRWKIFSWQHEE